MEVAYVILLANLTLLTAIVVLKLSIKRRDRLRFLQVESDPLTAVDEQSEDRVLASSCSAR
jgi:hypothetical protein